LLAGRLITGKPFVNKTEYPLNRLKSVQIAKRGVSFSSDVIIACANRGIKFFIQDFKNEFLSPVCF
jgi:CRISPR-associated protein Cas1